MSTPIHFESSEEIGCYMKLTNTYCLVAAGFSDSQYERINSELAGQIPVIPITIDGMSVFGRMCAGNSKGLIVPESTTDEEMAVLESKLPRGVRVAKVDERFSALGNVIVANDSVALIHPGLDEKTESVIAETLGVKVLRTTIGGSELVGSQCSLTNKGALVAPTCDLNELEQLTRVLQIPVISGTINRGSDTIGTGVVANDSTAFVGTGSTAIEMQIAESIFKLTQKMEVHYNDEEAAKFLFEGLE